MCVERALYTVLSLPTIRDSMLKRNLSDVRSVGNSLTRARTFATIIRRTTWERNLTNVRSVERPSVSPQSFESIRLFTRRRTSSSVRSVGRASVSSQVFKHIREFTLERSCTDVTYVGKASVTVPAFKTIRKSIPKKAAERVWSCMPVKPVFRRPRLGDDRFVACLGSRAWYFLNFCGNVCLLH